MTFDFSTFHLCPVIFQPCLLLWTDPRVFITDISPLTSWPFISKFWLVTPWPFAWCLLAPASLTDDGGHHDLWHQDLSPLRPSTPLTFHRTYLLPVTFDTTAFHTIIFEMNDLRLLNLSFLSLIFEPCLLFWTDLAFDFKVVTCGPMTFCVITFGTSIFDRWCWTPWPMTPRSFTWPTFDSTDLPPYRPSTRDLWHYDLSHHNLWHEWPSTAQSFIFDRWFSSHVYYFGPIWPLIFKLWPVTPWPFAWWPLAPASLTDDGGQDDLWHQDLLPHRPSTPLTFHPTDLRPVTFDTTTFDTIIFDLNDLRLLNLSSLPCEFRAMFIILDRPTRLHRWYFTFEFLAFHFQVLTCDLMTFCLITFGTSIFDRWCWTPWPMTPRSFTAPTFDSTTPSTVPTFYPWPLTLRPFTP